MNNDQFLAPPCGLFCGCCEAVFIDKDYHGCGCTCGKCAGGEQAQQCAISLCAKGKGLESCADCADLPCTRLIQFVNDPVWRTHLPALENLRRRKMIGTDKWIEEQKTYWSDPKQLDREIKCHRECNQKAQDWGKKA